MVQRLSIIAIAQILVISKLSAQGKMVWLRRKVFHIHSNIFCLLRKVTYSYEYFPFIAKGYRKGLLSSPSRPHHIFWRASPKPKNTTRRPQLKPTGKDGMTTAKGFPHLGKYFLLGFEKLRSPKVASYITALGLWESKVTKNTLSPVGRFHPGLLATSSGDYSTL